MGCRASSRVRIPLTPPVRQGSHASGGLLSFWAQCFRGSPAGGRFSVVSLATAFLASTASHSQTRVFGGEAFIQAARQLNQRRPLISMLPIDLPQAFRDAWRIAVLGWGRVGRTWLEEGGRRGRADRPQPLHNGLSRSSFKGRHLLGSWSPPALKPSAHP